MSAVSKLELLHLLNKLSDSHTRQHASQELSLIIERLDAHSLPVFLGCLHTTNAQHTLACRRGAVRLYSVVAATHSQMLLPYLPRVADSIGARVKDKDVTREVREACAATMAAIVEGVGADHATHVLMRPILPLFNEPNEISQLGAAACLSAIIQQASTNCPGLV